MDAQIRLRNPVAMPSQARRTITLRGTPIATVSALRKAILDCAHQATAAEPADTDRRLNSFIAKLSGTMEGLGERELDAVLWNLMETKPAPAAAPLPAHLPAHDAQIAMEWWNSISEERRAHWLSKAVSAVPFAAWLAFRRSEDDLAIDG